MKSIYRFLALGLMSLIAGVAFSQVTTLEESKVACRVWSVKYKYTQAYDGGPGSFVGAGTFVISSEALIDSTTLAVGRSYLYLVRGGFGNPSGVTVTAKQLPSVTLGTVSLDGVTDSEIRFLLLDHLRTNNGNATCLATGVETSLIASQVRKYAESTQRQIIEKQVSDEITNVANSIKAANESKRTEIINKLIAELPNNQNLVEALRNVLK